jgi:3-carboxy-cis,cis-muconate cycloisomerase
MAEVTEGLTVDPSRMRANIEATHGVIFAERAMMLLGEKLGRDAAHKLLEEATRQSVTQGRRLISVLDGMPEVTQHLDPATLRELDVPEQYLGMADEFRVRQLASAKERTAGQPKPGESKIGQSKIAQSKISQSMKRQPKAGRRTTRQTNMRKK